MFFVLLGWSGALSLFYLSSIVTALITTLLMSRDYVSGFVGECCNQSGWLIHCCQCNVRKLVTYFVS